MHWVIEILAALVAILGIILVHELGHFTLAKLLKVKVLRFSIGFGKALFKFFDRSGTEYRLAMFPLGGYVKMLNEGDLKEDNKEGKESNDETLKSQCYEHQAVWKRILILLAGPGSNFLLAFLLMWLMLIMGVRYVQPIIGQVKLNTPAMEAGLQSGDAIIKIKHRPVYGWADIATVLMSSVGDGTPISMTIVRDDQEKERFVSLKQLTVDARQFDVLGTLGVEPYLPQGVPRIAKIGANTPAQRAGLEIGDVLQQIGTESVHDWRQAQQLIYKYPGKTINITVLRQYKEVTFPVTLEARRNQNENGRVGYLGISFKIPKLPDNMIKKRQYSVFSAIPAAVSDVYYFIAVNMTVLLKMLKGQIALSGLSGPVGIVQTAGVASQAGLQVYLTFVALISVALGFINLLPIPLLDGGHLLFDLVELVIRREIPFNVKKVIWSMSFSLLLMLVIYATYNDLLQIIK